MKYNLEIKEIDKNICGSFIQKYHYSAVFPKLTKHWLGVFLDNKIVGAITLGWGTQPKQTIKKLFPCYDTKDYLEIGKMCMNDDMPKNSESQMMKELIKWLKINKPDLSLLYTMADGIMGKAGYVYQASNFYYGGEYWTDIFLTKDGEKVHPRSMKNILIQNAIFDGVEKLWWATPDYMKTIGMNRIKGKMFRYMYPLNKFANKLLISNEWTRGNYPKEENLKWKKQISKGKYEFINMPSFNNKAIVVNKKNIEQFNK